MSLELLFEDRKVRKYIRDGVNEAREIGKGECDCCGERKSLLAGFGKHFCEECISKAFEMADNYDTVYKSVTNEDVVDYIKEGYLIPDMTKLQNDANSKFGGSIPDLLSSYGLRVHKDWNDKLDKGMIYIAPGDHKGTKKTRLNQFMIDYSCEFNSARVAASHQADADGTMAPLIVNGTPLSQISGVTPTAPKTPKPATSASTSRATKQSSSASVTTVSTGYIGGNIDHFQIQMGDNEELDVKTLDNNGSKSFEVTYDGETYVIPSDGNADKDLKKASEYVKKMVIANPQKLFGAFNGINNGRFEINKYPVYKFALDEYSFGKQLTLAIVWKDKVHSKQRVPVQAKALKSVSTMNAELTKYMDAMVEKKYPALTKGKNRFKTSMGVAVFDLVDIDVENDIVTVSVDFVNRTFEARVDGTRLKDAASSKDAFAEVIMNALYATSSIYNFKGKRLLSDFESGKDTYNVESEIDGRKFEIIADFDSDRLYSNGDIVFKMSVIDDHTGEEWPKKREEIVIRGAGLNIKDIIKTEGDRIWKESFKGSNMTKTLTDSARAKMKSGGKKVALMDKIASMWMKNEKRNGNIAPEMLECEVELDMEVNKDGKPTKIRIKVTDPYAEYASDSKGLASILGLDKGETGRYIKFVKADSVMKDGPSVSYEVSDIEAFSEVSQLYVIENAILEAFGIITVNESGRKVFHI